MGAISRPPRPPAPPCRPPACRRTRWWKSTWSPSSEGEIGSKRKGHHRGDGLFDFSWSCELRPIRTLQGFGNRQPCNDRRDSHGRNQEVVAPCFQRGTVHPAPPILFVGAGAFRTLRQGRRRGEEHAVRGSVRDHFRF